MVCAPFFGMVLTLQCFNLSHQERILSIADEIVVIADGVVQQAGPRALVLPGLLDGAAGCTQCPNKEVGKQ